jgi:hypothetical protein
MNKSNRVLTRIGARELTVEETECVSGSLAVHTDVCSRPFPGATATVTGDGDACIDQ